MSSEPSADLIVQGSLDQCVIQQPPSPSSIIFSTGACPGYVKDHVLPLACGGPDSVANLQWQTVAAAKAKDVGAETLR